PADENAVHEQHVRYPAEGIPRCAGLVPGAGRLRTRGQQGHGLEMGNRPRRAEPGEPGEGPPALRTRRADPGLPARRRDGGIEALRPCAPDQRNPCRVPTDGAEPGRGGLAHPFPRVLTVTASEPAGTARGIATRTRLSLRPDPPSRRSSPWPRSPAPQSAA